MIYRDLNGSRIFQLEPVEPDVIFVIGISGKMQ